MPANCVYVGRGSQWGNPFVAGVDGTLEECLEKYKNWLLPYRHDRGVSMEEFCISEANLSHIKLLKGKDLMCWCALDQKCHADILLDIANS